MEWTGARYADNPTVEVSTWVRASPDAVWAEVVDLTRLPEASLELQELRWLDGAPGPSVGARFTGRNVNAALGEWTTTCTVLECTEPSALAWAVGDPDDATATWRFTLVPSDGGTLLTQWVRMGPGPSGLTPAIEAMPDKEEKIVFVRLRHFEEAMTATLAAIRVRAEA